MFIFVERTGLAPVSLIVKFADVTIYTTAPEKAYDAETSEAFCFPAVTNRKAIAKVLRMENGST
jgi:hypothetical protein